MNSSKVGLQACWYGSFYGDATYNHSPVPGQEANTAGNSTDQSVGIHLWYGNNDTSFNEVEWTYGSNNWTEQQIFNGFNGHAGVGCFSWGPGSVSYVFMVNLQNQVEIWWKDLNTTLKANATHPINTWTNSMFDPILFRNYCSPLVFRLCNDSGVSEQFYGLHELSLRAERRPQRKRL